MNKPILNKTQVDSLIRENRYKVTDQNKFLSRCIDGRYQNEPKLAPLAIPGADIGELAIIFAMANNFGFEIDEEKAFQSLIKTVGGVKNFQLHSDHHTDKSVVGGGCGHWKQINLDPQAYSLNKDQVDFIAKKLIEVKQAGAQEIVLEGEHLEGAVLQVKGNYSILPRSSIVDGGKEKITEVFVYQGTLVDARHRTLANALLKNGAIKLVSGQTEENLYTALSETVEAHLFETVKRLALGLPIFLIDFKDDGGFKIEELGKV